MQIKYFTRLLINTILIFLFTCQLSATNAGLNISKKKIDDLITKMKKCSTTGDHVNSIGYSKQVLKLVDMNKDAYWESLSILINAYQSKGQHHKALLFLEQLKPYIQSIESLDYQSIFFYLLGDLYLSIDRMDEAVESLEKAVHQASGSKNLSIQASLLNNLGNAYMSYSQYQQNEKYVEFYQKAMTAYRKCIDILSNTPGYVGLKSNVKTNMVLTAYQHDDLKTLSALLQNAFNQTLLLPDSSQKVDNLLSLIWISIQLLRKESWPDRIGISKQDLFRMSYQMIMIAKPVSYHLKELRYQSDVNGYLAQLYEMKGLNEEALNLTRKAIFFSEQGNIKDILYLWQSQLGRLFKSLGDIDKAILSYQDSINTLKPIKQALLTGLRNNSRIFEDKIKPVYLGLSKIYFEKATKATDRINRQMYLKLAWNIMEQMKFDELQNFFHNPCMTKSKVNDNVLDQKHPNTAIIYPILYDEYPVILMKLPDGLKHVIISEDSKKIKSSIYQLSTSLRNWESFEDETIMLYESLIHSIEPDLNQHNIDTLVVAADGVFCLIPFAALFDGDQYLIEKYAIVTIPSLALTNTDSVTITNHNALLAGFSKTKTKRQNFDILPNVIKEIDTIKDIVGGKKLVGEAFNKANIQLEFENNSFSIIHMATHGKFGRLPEQTFLLSYDGIITLNELQYLLEIQTFNKQAVELLSLSACETAAGNEQIAFGMAGIAVKTGVKSVIATLWSVDDMLSQKLLTEFYRQLSKKNISKAKALQFAQKKMLDSFHFDNPSRWASFLLIGNWK
jgi:CHAT domain-containing protein